jgi:DNA-binding CsgD family transcriptional regulator/PAS domain-containing protein
LDLLPEFPGFFYELRGFWDGDPQFRYMSSTRYITGHDVSHWPLDFAAAAELIHRDDIHLYKNLGARAREGGVDLSAEYRERDITGEYRWVREVATRSIDPSGASVLSGFCLDVTAARAYEAGLVERERRVRVLMASASAQVMEFDGRGRLDYASDDTICGYPSTAFGRDRLGWLTVVVDNDREHIRHVLSDAFARRTGCDVSFEIAHRDGTIRTARLTMTYFAGELGAPGWVGVLSDVTGPTRLAQRARLSDARARAIERHTRARVYLWHGGAATFDANALQIRVDVHRHDLADFNAAHEDLICSGGSCDVDFRWRRRPTDDWHWVRATAWSMGDGTTALGVFVPHDDIVAREHELARIENALTIREREMLQRLADGSSNRQLATALHLSETTVSHHVANVLKKLNLANRAAAAALASRLFVGD